MKLQNPYAHLDEIDAWGALAHTAAINLKAKKINRLMGVLMRRRVRHNLALSHIERRIYLILN